MRRFHMLSLAAAMALWAGAANADDAGVKIGFLTCHVSSGYGFVFGSSRDVSCTFAPNQGETEYYTGEIEKWGVDIGYIDAATIVWSVVAPTKDVAAGALEGRYGGVTAGASIGVGLGANVLVGGSSEVGQVALQPVSIEGNQGLNVAAGIAELKLESTQS
jgi:hypothetical protein